MKKKILILIPVYNAEDSIGETLQRLFDSFMGDFPTFELYFSLIDNGSTDKTVRVAQYFQKFGLSIFSFAHTPKRTENWNRCLDVLQKSGCDYGKFLFTGDSILPEGLAEQVDCIADYERENPNKKVHMTTSPHQVRVSLTEDYYMNHVPNSDRYKFFDKKNAWKRNKDSGNWMAGCVSVPLFSKEVVREARFNPTLQWASDWLFWLEVMDRADGVLFTKEPVAVFDMQSRKHYAELASSKLASLEEEDVQELISQRLKHL